MRFREIGSHLREEKRVLHCGMLLLGFAALLVLILMKFDQVWGAVSTVAGTVAPVFYGIAIAYILNVFVHFSRTWPSGPSAIPSPRPGPKCGGPFPWRWHTWWWPW